jgi:hypothetical protein
MENISWIHAPILRHIGFEISKRCKEKMFRQAW